MALKKIILNGTEIELPSGGGEPYIIDFDSLPMEISGEEARVLFNEIRQAYTDKRDFLGLYQGTTLFPNLIQFMDDGGVVIFSISDEKGFITGLSLVFLDFGDIAGMWQILPMTPTSTSQLDNDSNFISAEEIATINGQSLLNGGQDITIEGGEGNVPTKTSELTNDSGFITASDNVASATKLQTMRYINGSPFDGTANAVSYAVCATGASTTAKTVRISRFSLATGSQVRVKFSNANTASAPTLNVGSTGAKRMSYKGNLITNANFSFSTAKIYTFTYDGTYWVLEGDWDEAPKTSILTCEFMGEVGDIIWSDDDQDRIDYIADWMEALSMGKVCVLDFDEYEGTYAMVHAINYRTDATYGIDKVYFSYVFEGYLYDVEYESVSLPVTITIVNKTKIGGEGGSSSEGGSSAYAEVNHGTSDSTFTLTPNTFHVWDEVATLDLSLGAETSGVANEYLFQFTSGSTPTTLTLPDDIKFSEDLVIEANKIYQISILKGLGSVLSWDNAPNVTTISFKIGNYECIAEKGMTWEQWVNSEYNVNGFYLDYMSWIDTYVIAIGSNMEYGTIVGISVSDLILSGYEYEIYYENDGGPI